jgi:pyruvate kinase
VTPSLETARRLALVWGLHCLTCEEIFSLEDMVDRALGFAEADGFAVKGESVVITGGVPLGVVGATNMMRVAIVGAK